MEELKRLVKSATWFCQEDTVWWLHFRSSLTFLPRFQEGKKHGRDALMQLVLRPYELHFDFLSAENPLLRPLWSVSRAGGGWWVPGSHGRKHHRSFRSPKLLGSEKDLVDDLIGGGAKVLLPKGLPNRMG